MTTKEYIKSREEQNEILKKKVFKSNDYEKLFKEIFEITPVRYYKRNVPQYEFVNYISHLYVHLKNENFYSLFITIGRICDFIDSDKNRSMIEQDYLKLVIALIKKMTINISSKDLEDVPVFRIRSLEERIEKIKEYEI
ncbi:hypothetical protein [Aureivirga sp. CE67]|uniref:hypothetical protein n=1 Tax=Aureivirga sp. CE67 TaxID=1788983 RepID=UPI0018C9D197|nr:hypothetical protein [Aureivirga sp. CE67]